jgi:hypothetical protein
MKTVIVNATAAKTGGAQTILETFVDQIPNATQHQWVILTGLNISSLNSNVQVINKQTSGMLTFLFSTIGILWFQLRFRTRSVLSFNNVNSIFFPSHGVTYFHQLKALDPDNRELKTRLYQFVIKNFLTSNLFILQSPFVLDMFKQMFSSIQRDPIACWPGFTIPEETSAVQVETSNIPSKKLAVLPIAFPTAHKNVTSLAAWSSFLKKQKITVITLFDDPVPQLESGFQNIGSVNRIELFALYRKVDFLIFTSTKETVGLPIFEFLQTGKPAFVRRVQYSEYYYNFWDKPDNLFLYSSLSELSTLVEKHIDLQVVPKDYSQGEWHKIFEYL